MNDVKTSYLRGQYEILRTILGEYRAARVPLTERDLTRVVKCLERIRAYNDFFGIDLVVRGLIECGALTAKDVRPKADALWAIHAKNLFKLEKVAEAETLLGTFPRDPDLGQKTTQLLLNVAVQYKRPLPFETSFEALLDSAPESCLPLLAQYAVDRGLGIDAVSAVTARATTPQAKSSLRFATANASAGAADKASHLSGYWLDAGMTGVDCVDPDAALTPENLRFHDAPAAPGGVDGPLVSIVMTTFDSEAFVASAIRSLLRQTYRNIELIVCDDGSTDRTREVVAELAAADPRVRLLAREHNAGTYVAKSHAMFQARGTFVTFHDSDDVSHPQKIEREVSAMMATPTLVCLNTSWVRLTEDGAFVSKDGGSYAHLNPASTMFRREPVLDRIGTFDAVRTGADTKFRRHLHHAFGDEAFATGDIALTLGRIHPNSLTQSGAGAMNPLGGSAVRAVYTSGWLDEMIAPEVARRGWAPMSIRPTRLRVVERPDRIEHFASLQRFGMPRQAGDFLFVLGDGLSPMDGAQALRAVAALRDAGYIVAVVIPHRGETERPSSFEDPARALALSVFSDRATAGEALIEATVEGIGHGYRIRFVEAAAQDATPSDLIEPTAIIRADAPAPDRLRDALGKTGHAVREAAEAGWTHLEGTDCFVAPTGNARRAGPILEIDPDSFGSASLLDLYLLAKGAGVPLIRSDGSGEDANPAIERRLGLDPRMEALSGSAFVERLVTRLDAVLGPSATSGLDATVTVPLRAKEDGDRGRDAVGAARDGSPHAARNATAAR
jgi:hypothetical protein